MSRTTAIALVALVVGAPFTALGEPLQPAQPSKEETEEAKRQAAVQEALVKNFKAVAPELKDAVQAIHNSPALMGEFNPVDLIRAVNKLQALGETKAIEALKAYDALWENVPAGDWIFWKPEREILVLRLLYVPNDPAKPIPSPGMGLPIVHVKERSDLAALFPLVLQNDVPFRLNAAYALDGVPTNPFGYLKKCQSVGTFRKAPLKPTSDPLVAATAIIDGRLGGLVQYTDPRARPTPDENIRLRTEDLRGQAVTAAAHAIGDTSKWAEPGLSSYACSDRQWKLACEANKRAGTVWSEAAQDFVKPEQPKEK